MSDAIFHHSGMTLPEVTYIKLVKRKKVYSKESVVMYCIRSEGKNAVLYFSEVELSLYRQALIIDLNYISK